MMSIIIALHVPLVRCDGYAGLNAQTRCTRVLRAVIMIRRRLSTPHVNRLIAFGTIQVQLRFCLGAPSSSGDGPRCVLCLVLLLHGAEPIAAVAVA